MIEEIIQKINDIIIPVLTGLFGIATAMCVHYYTRYRDIKLTLSDRKYNCYAEVINILFDLIQENKGLKKKTSLKDLSKRVFFYKI